MEAVKAAGRTTKPQEPNCLRERARPAFGNDSPVRVSLVPRPGGEELLFLRRVRGSHRLGGGPLVVHFRHREGHDAIAGCSSDDDFFV